MPRSTRPVGRLDAQSRVSPYSFNDNAFRGEYTGTNLIYKGEARPGTAEGTAAWQIAKLAYDGAGNVTSITWPQNTFGAASNDYAFSWTARAGYTYS